MTDISQPDLHTLHTKLHHINLNHFLSTTDIICMLHYMLLYMYNEGVISQIIFKKLDTSSEHMAR